MLLVGMGYSYYDALVIACKIQTQLIIIRFNYSGGFKTNSNSRILYCKTSQQMPLLPFAFKATHVFLLLTTLFLTQTNCHISLLKNYESKHALAHVIKSLRQDSLDQMDSNYDQKCTVNSVCCLCQKNFKNTSFLEVHMQLQHPTQQETPQDHVLGSVFDKRINSELRFEICTKLLAIRDNSDLSQLHQSLSNTNSSQTISNSSTFQTALSKTQIIDICTIIAYGAYHQPLWRVWIKGTLIFAFVVVFIVYYASVADQVGDKYFKKKYNKESKVNQRMPQVIKEMY